MKAKLFLVAIILVAVFCVASTALAMTNQERQTLIAQIQAQIAQLLTQLQALRAQQQAAPQSSQAWCHTFNVDLDTGDTGSEVAALQKFLQEQDFTIASDELTSQTFGRTTGQAVKDFKKDLKTKYGSQFLTAVTTKVGDKTRGMLNKLYKCATESATIPTPASVTPTPASVTPVSPTPVCTPSWTCGWGQCVNGYQSQVVVDSNNCGLSSSSANIYCTAQVRACATSTPIICSPDWQCGYWSSCVNSQQIRACLDSNNCGVTTNKPATTQSCSSAPIGCAPNWQCANWGVCSYYGYQTRTCADASNCNDLTGKPEVSRNCDNPCAPSWQCGEWSICVNSQQTRTCADANNCGVLTGRPYILRGCENTCISNWQCSAWSSCASNKQTRTCADSNNCSSTAGKPAESQYCRINSCQQITVPGLNISCVFGLPPYGVSHTEMSYSQLNSVIASVGSSYSPQRGCGCSWQGQATENIKLSCPSSLAGCDFSKVPDKLPRRFFSDYCSFSNEVDPVEWSSRLAKGELYESAYQNTIENQKRIIIAANEKLCLEEMIDEYFIGGQTGSTNWMCPGEKYRLNPNSAAVQWQKWVNGAWTSDFGWNSSYTCQ